jgi:hypothetical protein
VQTVRQVVRSRRSIHLRDHAKTFYVLASGRLTAPCSSLIAKKHSKKREAARRTSGGWDYENQDEQSAERDESAGSRYADDEERYAAAEARDDQGSMFHAGEEDLQAFWDLHREAPDLQKIAAQQHTMKPNQGREVDNERHY